MVRLLVLSIGFLFLAGSAPPPLGTAWEPAAGMHGKPIAEAPWREGGRWLRFAREKEELQIYLDREGVVEGTVLLHPDGVELRKHPGILERLGVDNGVFIRIADEKDPNKIQFRGMGYLRTDDQANATTFFLTGAKEGYQRLYLEANFRPDLFRPFYRQLIAQVRVRIRWRP